MGRSSPGLTLEQEAPTGHFHPTRLWDWGKKVENYSQGRRRLHCRIAGRGLRCPRAEARPHK